VNAPVIANGGYGHASAGAITPLRLALDPRSTNSPRNTTRRRRL
jgi:hypothetical protein